MATLEDLNPKSRLKLLSAHPDFESYTPRMQELHIQDRLKKDKRSTTAAAAAAPKEAAATEAAYSVGNVSTRAPKTIKNKPVDTTDWVSPTLGHHAALDAASEALRNKLDTITDKDTRAVHAHLDKADAHLESHMSAHITKPKAGGNQAPLASAHLDKAAEHLTNAYRAMDIIHPNIGQPQAGKVEEWANNIANNYKANFAPGSKMTAPAPFAMATGANPVSTRKRGSREEEHARTAAKKEAAATLEAKRAPTEAQLRERTARGQAAAASFTGAMPESTGERVTTSTPPAEREKMRAAAYKKIVKKESTGGALPESLLSVSGKLREGSRDIVLHHAVVATQALRAGVKVPAKSQAVLGPKGMSAVTAAHKEWQNAQTEEESPEPSATSGSLRAAHLQAFASGRGM